MTSQSLSRLSACLLLVASTANAELSRTLTSGILFPTAADAVAMNPAALTDDRGDSVGRLAYDDPAKGYAGMFASSSDSFGKGAALNALGAGTLTLGGGYGGRFFRGGLNVSLNNTLNPGDGSIGLGFLMGGPAGLRFGLTLSSILKSDVNALTLGLGYAVIRDYQLEFDLAVPTSSLSAAGKPYTQHFYAIKYFQGFGLGIFESSKAGLKNFGMASPDFGGLLQFRIASSTHIDLRYDTAGGGMFGFGVLSKF